MRHVQIVSEPAKDRNREATSEERDEAEEDFFAKGLWATMDPTHLGVKSLRSRLSNVLKDQILYQLPSPCARC